jgi:uncharacterized protein (TIGR03067 family)
MRRVVIVLAMLLAAASCGNSDDPSLTGVWTGTEVGGTSEEWTFTIDAADFSAESEGTEIYKGTYVAFADEDPKRMESTITESLFPPFVGLTALAIYEFDGTTLILASNEPGIADVPTEFVPGGGTRVWEFTKQ